MKTIKVGAMILVKRKENRITQEQLANHLGVSKTAVSKWETDQSYPDISLLPVIASYFKVSIDELIGYEAQMSKEEITIFYKKICQDFVDKPLEEVFSELEITMKKYYACYTLQYYIALLYVNHISLLKDQKEIENVYHHVKEIAQRVKSESDDLQERKRGEELEVLCYLGLKDPKSIFKIKTHVASLDSNYLLANAYYMDEQPEKAIRTLQVDIFQGCCLMNSSLELLLMLYANKPEQFEKCVEFAFKLNKELELVAINAGLILPIYIATFAGYAMQGNKEKALQYLSEYVHLVLYEIKDFNVHGNEFFYAIDDFLTHGNDIEIGLPRDTSVIKKSAVQAVLANPALQSLQDDAQFQALCAQLERERE